MAHNALEKRIQQLEDIESIKCLKFDYAEGCDVVANQNNLGPLLRYLQKTPYGMAVLLANMWARQLSRSFLVVSRPC